MSETPSSPPENAPSPPDAPRKAEVAASFLRDNENIVMVGTESSPVLLETSAGMALPVLEAPPLTTESLSLVTSGPPALPVVPPIFAIPPLLAPPPARASASLWMAVTVAGALALLASITLSGQSDRGASYRVGTIVGAMTAWPLVVLGVMSLIRRFRSQKARAIILLVVWSLTALGQLGNLVQAKARPRSGFPGKDLIDAVVNSTTGSARETASADTSRAAVVPVADPAAATEFDFTTGSDERLVKLIENSQEERYHRIVAAYEAACAARPDDPVLALEWVRFVDHFVYAEDIHVESAEDDRTRARAYLEQRFPGAPSTVLYLLENSYGGGFTAKVAEHLPAVAQWPASDAANFHLLRAQREDLTAKPGMVQLHAETSFNMQPTPEAGLLLARALFALERKTDSLNVLQKLSLAQAPDWLRRQGMDLLFDLGETAPAMALFEELKVSAPHLVQNDDVAGRLGRAGRVAAGRALLGELAAAGWDETWIARKRFEFELDFGDAEQAQAAYSEFRDLGVRADPLGRQRFELWRRHPLVSWRVKDAVGLALLGLGVLAAAALPLLILAPVHYWSLRRERRGRTATWTISPWGLRAAWCVLGVAVAGELIVTWYFNPQLLGGWLGVTDLEAEGAGPTLPAVVCMWILLGTTMLGLLWRARGWRLFGGGTWSVGKSIGIGLGLALALRLAVAIYVLAVPTAEPVLAQVSPVTTELLRSLHAAVGSWGLLLVVAGFVPLLEEVVFRGVLLGALAKHIPFNAANAVQAVGFALLHESLLLAPFFFTFAFVAGMLVRQSRGLLPAIVVHVCNNALACLVLIVAQASPAASRLGL